MRKTNADVYEKITAKIIAELEAGHAPWLKPWSDTKANRAGIVNSWMPRNAISGRYYQGINVLLTWGHMDLFGLDASRPLFLTFDQARKAGGHVRKGSKGLVVIAYNRGTRTVKEADGTESKKAFLIAVTHLVFHIDQTENVTLPEIPPHKLPRGLDTDEAWQDYIKATKADIRHGGDRAYYARKPDYIQMPTADAFHGPHHYKATALHELTHWTGHETRLNREFGKRFGDNAYAFEELVAEMGAAFLCADLGIEHKELRHAGYLKSWLDVIKANPRSLITAASAASKAATYLGAIARGEEAPPLGAESILEQDANEFAELAA